MLTAWPRSCLYDYDIERIGGAYLKMNLLLQPPSTGPEKSGFCFRRLVRQLECKPLHNLTHHCSYQTYIRFTTNYSRTLLTNIVPSFPSSNLLQSERKWVLCYGYLYIFRNATDKLKTNWGFISNIKVNRGVIHVWE